MIAKTTTTTHLAQMLSSACRLRRYDMRMDLWSAMFADQIRPDPS